MRGIRFSSRTTWDLRPNRQAERLGELLRDGIRVIDLTESNPTRCGFDYPKDEIRQAVAKPGALLYEPDARGLRSAREAVAGELDRHGHRVDPDSILLCSGTSEAYTWLFKVLCEPGDHILVPAPSYPLLDLLTQMEGIELVRYPLQYDGSWHVDVREIGRLCGPRTRAIVIVQPNNPTGSFLSLPDLESLGALCAQRGLALISDEVFFDFVFDPRASFPPSALDNLDGLRFALGGLSKSAGLPQMKVAWITVTGPAVERNEALHRLETIADTFLSVNTPVQVALGHLLRAGARVREEILARVRHNRSALLDLRGSASCWDCLGAEAGWYSVLRVPRMRTDEDWCLMFLEQDHVQVHPGYFYDFPVEGHLVVSLLPRAAEFRDGIERVVRRLEAEAR